MPLAIIAEAAQAIFFPLIGTGSGLIVAEGFPGIAIGAVVLAHRAPFPLAQGGAPLASLLKALVGLKQALIFGSLRRRWLGCGHRHGWIRVRLGKKGFEPSLTHASRFSTLSHPQPWSLPSPSQVDDRSWAPLMEPRRAAPASRQPCGCCLALVVQPASA